jgi:putative phosphoesterase
MVIGVISDTHGHPLWIEKAVEKLKDSDVLIHLGDYVNDLKYIKKEYKGEIISVKGNCDFDSDKPVEILEEIEGKIIFITHGHRYNCKTSLTALKFRALELGADIVLFGHTHLPEASFDEGVLFVNPGSASSGKSGFNSVAKLEIIDGKIIPNIIKIENK